MADGFLVLRGASAGPVFLARPDHYGDADTWTERREDARRFATWDDTAVIRDEIVARNGVAVAVVPDGGA